MVLIRKRTVLGLKTEATPGVKQTLAAADGATVFQDFTLEPDITLTELPAVQGAGTRKSQPGARKGKAAFKIPVRFDGLAVPPWADTLFPACGLVKTGTVFSPKTQTPDTGGATTKTLTIGKWMDGKLAVLYGAMGTVKLAYETGEIAMLEFEFQGVYDGEIDQAVPAPTYLALPELRCAGGPVTFDSQVLCLKSWSFDLANKLYVKECPSTVQAYDFCVVADRAPKVTADPESVLVATKASMNQFLNGTEGILRYVLPAPGYVPGTGAKSIEFLANNAQYSDNKEGDREGVSIDSRTWMCNNGLTLDSDFSITFNL
jgi:hypothetical protein